MQIPQHMDMRSPGAPCHSLSMNTVAYTFGTLDTIWRLVLVSGVTVNGGTGSITGKASKE